MTERMKRMVKMMLKMRPKKSEKKRISFKYSSTSKVMVNSEKPKEYLNRVIRVITINIIVNSQKPTKLVRVKMMKMGTYMPSDAHSIMASCSKS